MHIYAEGITKTTPSGLRQTSWLQLPKMFETQSERCPVKLFQKYLLKRPVGMEKSGPFYLQPIVNPLTSLWYKKTLMGINSINSMMKDLISNSPLQKSEKHLANHSARKTLVKKLKQKQVPKSEIISITGHNREAGLDAYDSSDEMQQKQLSHFIDNHQPTASKNKYSISPNNPIIRNTSFSFFPNDDQFYQSITARNFFSSNNCVVHFDMNNQVKNVSSSVDNPKKTQKNNLFQRFVPRNMNNKKLSHFASC